MLAESQFLQIASEIASNLQNSLDQLFSETRSPTTTRGRTARAGQRIGPSLSPMLRSRMSRALATDNSLASLYYLPGPDGLRSLLKKARTAGLTPDLIDQCEIHVDQLEQLLNEEDATRETLHAMLGGLLPEARDSMVRSNSQSAFRAMCNLIGYYADVWVGCRVLFPGSSSKTVSAAQIRGYHNWRRLRADCVLSYAGYCGSDDEDRPQETTLDGRPLASLDSPALLEDFCSRPLPKFQRVDIAGQHVFRMISSEIGVRSACSLYFGEIIPDFMPRYRTSEAHFCPEAANVITPAKKMLFDVIVHKKLWPGSVPTVETHRTIPYGMLRDRVETVRRSLDHIDLGLSIRRLPEGLGAIDSAAVGEYRGLVRHLIESVHLSPSDLVGFRIEIQYPLYSTQVTMRFDLPECPESTQD